MHDQIPLNSENHSAREVTYYQWIPLILLFMALCFKFPNILWRQMSGYSGININKIVEVILHSEMDGSNKQEETSNNIANYIHKRLESTRGYSHSKFRGKVPIIFFLCNKRGGHYLTGLYLLVKCIYFAHVIIQFFIMDTFLGGFYNFWGIERIMKNESSKMFPRVTLCDFKIRQLHNVQHYTVQCVLPHNVFNEKIFVILWYWLIVMAIITGGNLLFSIFKIVRLQNRNKIMKRYLKATSLNDHDRQQFMNTYLRADGFFVLEVIHKHSNDILLAKIVLKLWELFTENQLEPNPISDVKAELILNKNTFPNVIQN